jgi:hypothetical protein
VTAHFTRPPPPPQTHQLTVRLDGHGSVRSSPMGIDCGNTCSAAFTAGAQVALTPMPDAGYAFSGWNGVCIGSGACIVMMSDDANVIAKFDPLPPRMVSLTVSVDGPGSVTGSGIDCPAKVCTVQLPQGSSFRLTATPSAGARLMSWSGCGSQGAGGPAATCGGGISQDLTIQASFQKNVVMLAPADGTNSTILAINSTTVFFQRYGSGISGIWSVPKGGGAETLVTLNCCTAIMAADDAYVYLSDNYSISRVPVTGGNAQVLYSGYYIGRIELDGATIYWTQSPGYYGTGTAGIYSMGTSGGAARLVVAVHSPFAVAVDSQYLYWTDKDGDGFIRRLRKVGGPTETMIDCGACTPAALRVDSANIYYRNTDGDGWSRAKGGGDFHKLTTGNPGASNVWGVNLEVNASVAYWTWLQYQATDGVFSARADGTGWTAIDTAQDESWSRPVVDDKYIFYFHAGALYRRFK